MHFTILTLYMVSSQWVPWSTATGAHERFIAERIYSLDHLNDQEKLEHHYEFHIHCYHVSTKHPFFCDLPLRILTP